MEIERGIKIESSDEWNRGLSNWESGLSSGPRSMEQVPAYTDEELRQGLGKRNAAIEEVFQPRPEDEPSESESESEPDLDLDLVGGGTA